MRLGCSFEEAESELLRRRQEAQVAKYDYALQTDDLVQYCQSQVQTEVMTADKAVHADFDAAVIEALGANTFRLNQQLIEK